MLIEGHYKNIGDDWESFLVRNHFKEVEQEEPNNKIKRSRRRLSINPNDDLCPQQEKPSEDETPLEDVIQNLIKKNVGRKKASDKEESTPKRKTKETKQEKIEQREIQKQIPLTNTSATIRRRERLNKTMKEPSR